MSNQNSVFSRPMWEGTIVKSALIEAFKKLDPRHQFRNPVMFVVWVGSILTTGLFFHALFSRGEESAAFILGISLWLWLTVLFANFAEAMAEGRGKAQAATLKNARQDVPAKKLAEARYGAAFSTLSAP